MRTETILLAASTPGTRHELTLLHFGTDDGGPKAYIQAGLHADEAPGMLCAHALRKQLTELEGAGKVRGLITLVPAANPLGMGQFVLGSHHGRFALADGINFNRDYPELADEAASIIDGQLGDDRERNRRVITGALLAALGSLATGRPEVDLKQHLLGHALEADTILDLHCDGEACVHLYTLTGQSDAFMPLARWLGAEAVLTAQASGGNPFDEAVTRAWATLKQRFHGHILPEGPIAATVELRGERDVSHELAAADALAIIDFLGHRGHLDIVPRPLPTARCVPSPLEGCEALEAPCAGLVVFRQEVGAMVATGEHLADIIDPVSGNVTAVHSRTDGLFFARTPVRFAQAGRRIGKIAGVTPFRNGNLLSP